MADVKSDIAAYAKMQEELEEKHMGKWVLWSIAEVFAPFSEG